MDPQTVAIIEDDPALLRGLKDNFDLAGFGVLTAADGEKGLELILDARPDFLLLGASGLWTMNTPQAFRELSLPTLKRATRMAREAGVPTMLHSCGKERDLVRICAQETDLDDLDPLV